jgi:hypothetical protein
MIKSTNIVGLTREQPPKRTAADANLEDDSDGDSWGEGIPVTDTPQQIRGKIKRFIDNGGMKVGEFMKAINVSSVSYYGFMKQNGNKKGHNSNTYYGAMRFFQKRAERGVPFPKKQKAAAPKAAAQGSTAAAAGDAPAAWRSVELPGEAEDAVPIFDSCDEVRRKINAHLRKPAVTQAAFLRDLVAQFHGPRRPSRALQGAQLSRFRGQSGPVTGNTSGVYYAAYVFFEKERVAAGKPKTVHRRDMEVAWLHGVDTKSNLNSVWTFGSGPAYMDSLGRVSGRGWH